MLLCRGLASEIEGVAVVKQGSAKNSKDQVVVGVHQCPSDWPNEDRVFESFTDLSVEGNQLSLIHLVLGFKHLTLCLELSIG